MGDTRRKDAQWGVCGERDSIVSFDGAQLAVLMDIRDELKAIRMALQPLQRLNCRDFLDIPHSLGTIARNTTRKKRKPTRRVAS